jgi:alpha-galactosidase
MLAQRIRPIGGPSLIRVQRVQALLFVSAAVSIPVVSSGRRDNRQMPAECAVAARLGSKPSGEGFPTAEDWLCASPIIFDRDWRGENQDPSRETQVRLLWSPDLLFVQFQARYRTITIFADAEPDGRRDQLWDRDVAEVFLQPDATQPRRYKEFEVSPNGFWIDLEIDLDTPERKRDLRSGLRCKATVVKKAQFWTVELVIPMKSLVRHFDRGKAWRVNFYRVEGSQEPRFYSAWRPTGTPKPDFHVPEAFAKLIFADK